MPGKKTGLYLSPIAEEIVNRVAEKYGYTKVSNTINFIVLEYDKMINQDKQEETKEKIFTPIGINRPCLSDWFVSEDKNA